MENKRKILYIVPHRFGRSPGQRFRCEQYIPHLQANGFEITYSNLLTEKDDAAFYAPKKYFSKFIILLKSFCKRCRDVKRAFNHDYIFIYRESMMIGTTVFDRLFKLSGAKIIIDFDDSIWLPDTSEGNANLSWLKKPSKINNTIRLADMVFAGNAYLAEYALQFNKNVKIVPTTIDTTYHKNAVATQENKQITIGWTGTSTTLKHFESIVDVLITLKQKYGNRICFKLISDVYYKNEALELETSFWNKLTEIADLLSIDIGIMPLPDNRWTRGKCGFKGLQYMSLGIPAVMSGVGVNCDIIDDGVNGFIANTPVEWETKLSLLIEDTQLRKKLGECGKETIYSRYSVDAIKNQYIEYFRSLYL